MLPNDVINIIQEYNSDPLEDIRYEFHERLKIGKSYYDDMGTVNRYYPMSEKIKIYLLNLFDSIKYIITNFRFNLINLSEVLDNMSDTPWSINTYTPQDNDERVLLITKRGNIRNRKRVFLWILEIDH